MTLGCRILPLLHRHATCLSKPTYRETKPPPPPHDALLLLNLSLAAHLTVYCLTRLDVQLERMFAVGVLLGMAWSTSALGAACPSPLLRRLLTTACCEAVSGLIMRGVCNLTCKCWMKGNDQQRSEGCSPTALFRHGPLSDLRRGRVSCVSCGILRVF